jgi:hypothetical protein
VDLRQVNRCDMDGTCVKVCPTNVVTLAVDRLEEAETTEGAASPLLLHRSPDQPQ